MNMMNYVKDEPHSPSQDSEDSGSPDGTSGHQSTSPPGSPDHFSYDNKSNSEPRSKDGPSSPVSLSDVLRLSGTLDLSTALSNSGKAAFDWATKVKEWQTAEQLARMRDEEPLLKNGLEKKFPELCVVCGDKASGRHYGAVSCEGCKGFFKRSIRKQLGYSCRGNRDCEVTKHHRNRCQHCRLQKCLNKGMRADSVQSERRPQDVRDKIPPLIPVTPEVLYAAANSLNVEKSNLNTLANVAMKHISNDSSQDAQLVIANGESSNSRYSKEKASGKKSDIIVKTPSGSATSLIHSESQMESAVESEGPLLLDCHIPFHLKTPNTGSSLNIQYICESGSRLLFLSLHWARSIPAFQTIRSESQTILARHCWSELFILGLSQCAETMCANNIFAGLYNYVQSSAQKDHVSSSKFKQLTDHICKLQYFITTMQRLRVDPHEYAYLKAITLFNPDHFGLHCTKQIENFQERAVNELKEYVRITFPECVDRFAKLLLRLTFLRSLPPSNLEDLFFEELIGCIEIDSIIPYILRMDTNEYTPDIGTLMGNKLVKGQ